MRRSLEHDKQSAWRLDPGSVGWLTFAALMVAAVFVFRMLGCATSTPPCVPTRTAAIVADCRAQYRKAGCADDPDGECPDLVKACDARVASLSDYEICTP